MKALINNFLLALTACVVSATELGEDIYLFLPFLRNPEPPPSCPVNEYWKACVSECSNCEQRGKCITATCRSGCDCAPRFFRLTPDGPCEPVANCPKPECGENEVFRDCGPMCERCATIPCKVISCDHKCYCKEGYRRNDEGECIPEEECPKRSRCFKNEVWSSSGPVDEFCLHGEKEDRINITRDIEQCYCKEGFRRNALGHCDEEKNCSKDKCLGVEIYHDCVPKCNTTCRNYGNPNCTEDDNCYPGCFCPPGYLMNDFRSCIPMQECSLDLSQVKFVEVSDTNYEEESTNTTTSDDADIKSSELSTTDYEDKSTRITESDTVTDTTNSAESDETYSTFSTSQGVTAKEENYAKEKSKTPNEKVAVSKGESADEDAFDNEEI